MFPSSIFEQYVFFFFCFVNIETESLEINTSVTLIDKVTNYLFPKFMCQVNVDEPNLLYEKHKLYISWVKKTFVKTVVNIYTHVYLCVRI